MAKGGIADSKDSVTEASELTLKSKETQANTLIYSMSEEADDVLYSIGLSNDRKKYDTVTNKSKAHFFKRRNPMYE